MAEVSPGDVVVEVSVAEGLVDSLAAAEDSVAAAAADPGKSLRFDKSALGLDFISAIFALL